MKIKRYIAFALIYCFLFSTQAFTESFEYYVTLQIGNANYNYRYGERPDSIQPLDKDDPNVKPFIHEGWTMLPMRAVANIIIFERPEYVVFPDQSRLLF
jgi:hypothetical protein